MQYSSKNIFIFSSFNLTQICQISMSNGGPLPNQMCINIYKIAEGTGLHI